MSKVWRLHTKPKVSVKNKLETKVANELIKRKIVAIGWTLREDIYNELTATGKNELEEDEFWYFITANIPPATPIDYIFSLSKVVKKQENYQGEYPIFNAYYNAYKNAKNKKQWVETQWNEVRNNFLTLKEWFKDFEYYHLVGALIHLGYNINTIFDLKLQSNSKTAFKEALKAEFTKIIGSFGNNLENVYYSSGKERKALLLFNIISILQSEEKAYRFPFNKFKTMNWDIEHIHAIATDTNNKDVQKAWLSENKEYISGILRKEIEDILSLKEIEEEKLSSLVEKVTNELSEKEKEKEIFKNWMEKAKVIDNDLKAIKMNKE